LDTPTFMYGDSKLLGKFFGTAPSRIAFSLFLLSIVVLVLPAWGLNLLFITDHGDHDVSIGFLQSLNWSMMYPIVLPLLFASAAALSSECTRRIARLADPEGMNVIRHDDGSSASDFMEALSAKIVQRSRPLFWGCLILTAVLVAADTWTMFGSISLAILHRHQPLSTYIHSDWDWTVAFAMNAQRFQLGGNGQPPGIVANALFDLAAYLMEAGAIFLGLYFVGKFWITLNAFSDLLVDPRSGFSFFPWWEDRFHRMGLRSIGYLFNRFLGITIAFQMYVLYLRLQLINRHSCSFWEYASSIADQTKHLTELQNFWNLRAFNSISVGLLLLLILGTLPIIVISWVPLLKLRPYLMQVRDKNEEQTHKELQRLQPGSPEAIVLDARAKAIDDACIWPNGDAAGWLFFITMIVVAVLSVLPPFIAYVIGFGIIGALAKVVPLPWQKITD
jgi:hypothetical protein